MAKLNIHGVLAIMGRQASSQYNFFLTGINLGKRISEDHILRMISEKVGFDLTYIDPVRTSGASKLHLG